MSLPSLAVRTAMLPPAPRSAVTLRRRGVALILLLALAARALARKSWGCGGACWRERCRAIEAEAQQRRLLRRHGGEEAAAGDRGRGTGHEDCPLHRRRYMGSIVE